MKNRLARRLAARGTVAGAQALLRPPTAQDKTVKIGVLNDMSSLYADIGGPNSVVAVKMAVEDSGPDQEGLEDRRRQRRSPEQAGRRRQPRAAVDRQRQGRCDRRYAELRRGARRQATSSRRRTAVLLNSGARPPISPARPARRTRSPSPTTPTCWRNGTGKALTKAGGDSWFFLTADYAFGHALER
jgi:branched-chain amino acid transport system substrate-binding protein